jgi:acetoin utilization deacetylase AcuC-like enzyme
MLREKLSYSSRVRFVEPIAIERSELLWAHEEGYVDRFLMGRLSDKEMRQIGLRPWTDQMVVRTQVLMGGTLGATKHALQDGMAGHLAGGTHHAHYGYGSGYCIFNDLAVSARWLQRQGVSRILMLDLDVHQGDGTATIFTHDSQVYTLSIHCAKNFPFRKQQSDMDIALPQGIEDQEYLDSLSILPQLLRSFRPQFVFFQGGVDGLKEDKLGKWNLTRAGLQKRNRFVYQLLSEQSIPVVITMGGGYAEPLSCSVDAHTDLFLQAASFCSPCFF